MEMDVDPEEDLRRMRGPSPERFVRVLPPGQIVSHQRPEHDFVTNERDVVGRYVGSALRPSGGSDSSESGLYSYMRKYGGAGYQGMVENPVTNAPIIHSHLTAAPKRKPKDTDQTMRDRGRPKSKSQWPREAQRGRSFDREASPGRNQAPERDGRFVAMIDSEGFTPRVLSSETSRQQFLGGGYVAHETSMYGKISSEHVVVTQDDVPATSISSLGFLDEGPSLVKTTMTLEKLARQSHEAHRRIGARLRLLQRATGFPNPYSSFTVGYNVFENAELQILAYRDGYYQVQVLNGVAELYARGSPTRGVSSTDAIYLPEHLFTSTVMKLL